MVSMAVVTADGEWHQETPRDGPRDGDGEQQREHDTPEPGIHRRPSLPCRTPSAHRVFAIA
jgi:hypothetical protein